MSRALLVIAFAQALGRQPTDQERSDFLCALAGIAGGEYLYVPKLPQSEVDAGVVQDLYRDGMSIRKIARKLGVSKSTIGRVIRQPELSQLSPYVVDSKAA